MTSKSPKIACRVRTAAPCSVPRAAPSETRPSPVGGACLEIDDDASQRLPKERPDLSCVAIDSLGRHWAAGNGRCLVAPHLGRLEPRGAHAAWQPPFVSIMAEIGTVTAMTVDGAVLECRSLLLDKTSPAL